MNPIEQLLLVVPQIEDRLKYTFNDKNLLVLSFVHRSFYNEHRDLVDQHNERLEFLGDSVLGLLVSQYLYKQLPKDSEGHLSLLRSQIVESGSCAHLLAKLDVSSFVLLGKGERFNDGRGRETILADLFEALIAAIYLDGGIDAATTFFFDHFTHELQVHLQQPATNWKATLQDYSQKKHQKPPLYKVVKEEGPDHSKRFHVVAYIEEVQVGDGVGSTKKEGEQAAAENALRKLGVVADE